jgi:hypothetical protein
MDERAILSTLQSKIAGNVPCLSLEVFPSDMLTVSL